MTRPEKTRCDACPVMCYIAEGRAGACDRYANEDGRIIRCDPLTILDRRIAKGDEVKPFLADFHLDRLAIAQPKQRVAGDTAFLLRAAG